MDNPSREWWDLRSVERSGFGSVLFSAVRHEISVAKMAISAFVPSHTGRDLFYIRLLPIFDP